jgi:hypothetical protein
VIIMVLAIVFHLFRREWPNILLNFVLGLFPAAVVYGRLVIAPSSSVVFSRDGLCQEFIWIAGHDF